MKSWNLPNIFPISVAVHPKPFIANIRIVNIINEWQQKVLLSTHGDLPNYDNVPKIGNPQVNPATKPRAPRPRW